MDVIVTQAAALLGVLFVSSFSVLFLVNRRPQQVRKGWKVRRSWYGRLFNAF